MAAELKICGAWIEIDGEWVEIPDLDVSDFPELTLLDEVA